MIFKECHWCWWQWYRKWLFELRSERSELATHTLTHVQFTYTCSSNQFDEATPFNLFNGTHAHTHRERERNTYWMGNVVISIHFHTWKYYLIIFNFIIFGEQQRDSICGWCLSRTDYGIRRKAARMNTEPRFGHKMRRPSSVLGTQLCSEYTSRFFFFIWWISVLRWTRNTKGIKQ